MAYSNNIIKAATNHCASYNYNIAQMYFRFIAFGAYYAKEYVIDGEEPAWKQSYRKIRILSTSAYF